MNERTRQTVRAQRQFDVMWSVTSWGYDEEWLMQEMALVMTDREFDTLTSLSPGAREVYLVEFWHGLDPTPSTAENETFRRFRKRIRLADDNYAQTLRRGILTDRGRVLVRPSGTEQLVRVMVEAPTEDEADDTCSRLVDVVRHASGG